MRLAPLASRPLATAPAAPLRPAAAARPAAQVRTAAPVATAAPARTAAPALKAWGDLSANQQAVLGPQGAQVWGRLSADDKEVFLLLTQRMDRAGADYGGLRLQDPESTIRRNRLLFDNNPEGLERLRASLEQGVEAGTFAEDKPFAPFHWGRADWGVRESRTKWTMQIGIGKDGAFVDVDRYNYKNGWKAFLGHTAELVHPGRPDPAKVAAELGVQLGPVSGGRRAA